MARTAGVDKVRELQRTLYRAAKADPGRRFHALYDKVHRRDVLERAWALVRANKGVAGIDRQTIGDVEEYGVAKLLDEVAADLKDSSYRPLPARRVFIPNLAGRMSRGRCRSLHRLDGEWQTRGSGVMVRYADDLLALCQTRREAESAIMAFEAILAEMGLELKQAKTPIVNLREGGKGVDFLGFHHRWARGRTAGTRHIEFLARWPSRQAMQHARDRVRELTARDRLRWPVEQVVGDLNRFLAAGRATSATATRPSSSTGSSVTRNDDSSCGLATATKSPGATGASSSTPVPTATG